MIRGKRLLGLGVLVFCLLLWFLIIPNQTEGKTGAEFPRLIVLFLAIPGAVLLLRSGAATGAAPPEGRRALCIAAHCPFAGPRLRLHAGDSQARLLHLQHPGYGCLSILSRRQNPLANHLDAAHQRGADVSRARPGAFIPHARRSAALTGSQSNGHAAITL